MVIAPLQQLNRAEPVLCPTFADILALRPEPKIIAVDMPIGLPERVGPGGRDPERLVRPLLGARQSSVFSVPARAAVMQDDYHAACAAALAHSDPPRKVSKQCFHIFPKIREIDALMTPDLQSRVYESHPELAFWALNGEQAVPVPKKVKSRPNTEGLDFRRDLLARAGFARALLTETSFKARDVGADDLLDACATCWSAARIARGEAKCFPPHPRSDGKGLRTAIWA